MNEYSPYLNQDQNYRPNDYNNFNNNNMDYGYNKEDYYNNGNNNNLNQNEGEEHETNRNYNNDDNHYMDDIHDFSFDHEEGSKKKEGIEVGALMTKN